MERQVYYSVNFYSVLGRELRYLTTNLYLYSEYSANYNQLMVVVRRECRNMELLLWKKSGFRGKVVFCLGSKPSGSSIVGTDSLVIPGELR